MANDRAALVGCLVVCHWSRLSPTGAAFYIAAKKRGSPAAGTPPPCRWVPLPLFLGSEMSARSPLAPPGGLNFAKICAVLGAGLPQLIPQRFTPAPRSASMPLLVNSIPLAAALPHPVGVYAPRIRCTPWPCKPSRVGRAPFLSSLLPRC